MILLWTCVQTVVERWDYSDYNPSGLFVERTFWRRHIPHEWVVDGDWLRSHRQGLGAEHAGRSAELHRTLRDHRRPVREVPGQRWLACYNAFTIHLCWLSCICIHFVLAKLPGVVRVDLWFDTTKVEHLQSPILTNVVLCYPPTAVPASNTTVAYRPRRLIDSQL